jgi:hypothetical protein
MNAYTLYAALALGGIVNLCLWFLFFSAQEYAGKQGTLPQRKPFGAVSFSNDFLYVQDYFSTFWGDLVGMSLIDAAFVLIFKQLCINPEILMPAFLSAIAATFLFHTSNTHPSHRPNFSYPKWGVMSVSGILHLFYFFLQTTIVSFTGIFLVVKEADRLVIMLFGLGLIFYLGMFLLDVFTGRFKYIY